MTARRSRLHSPLYVLFVVTGGVAVGLALAHVWGLEPNLLSMRMLGTCLIVALASGFALSVNRIVDGKLPEDFR